MARTPLTVNNVVLGGTEFSITSGTAGTADGHSIVNTGNEFILVYNANVGSLDLTIVSGKSTSRGADWTDETIAIGASKFELIGPFETAPFNQTGNLVHIDFEAASESDFTVTAFKFTDAG